MRISRTALSCLLRLGELINTINPIIRGWGNYFCRSHNGSTSGPSSATLASKFIRLGLVREAKAKAGMPVWRRDDDGNGFALKLTAAD